MYELHFSNEAIEGLAKLKKSEPIAFKKAQKLLEELMLHPTSGTGKPKPLGGSRAGQWSRRITDKHRLVYEIDENIVTVYVLTTYGHYDDK